MKLAIFASGGGSNFQAIVDAVEAGVLRAEVVLCVCNRRKAGVLDRASAHDIPTFQISPDDFPDLNSYTARLLKELEQYGVDHIALAGYMKMIPSGLVEKYRGRIVNIHPALLPKFGGKGMYGMHVHRAVLAAGESISGATVHIVDEDYDTGPIVLQLTVPVHPEDTPESLASRVLEAEHRLYPEALALFADAKKDD